MMKHFSVEAMMAIFHHAAGRALSDDVVEMGIGQLLLGILDADGIGGRAVAAAGVPVDAIDEIIRGHQPRHRSAGAIEVSSAGATYSPHRPARFWRRPTPPATGYAISEDVQQIWGVAWSTAQRRPKPTIDTGDLLLGALESLADQPMGTDLARIGLEPAALTGRIEDERRTRPERAR